MLCQRQRFRACGREQRAFRSPFGILRGRPLIAMFLLQNNMTRSAFSLSPLATKASLPKGLSDHCRSAFDFRLRRTRHWRAVALWKPSGGRPLAAMFFIQHSMKSSENPNRLSCWFGLFVCPSCRILLLILQHPAYSPARLRKLFQRHGLILPRKEGVPWRSWLCYSFPWR